MRRSINLRTATIAICLLAVQACVATTVTTRPIALGNDSARVVTQPARAQLLDSSIVVFHDGFRTDGGRLLGAGWRYKGTPQDSVSISAVPMDSVASVVTLETGYDTAKSLGMTAAAGVTLFFLLAIAFIAGCAATSCLRN